MLNTNDGRVLLIENYSIRKKIYYVQPQDQKKLVSVSLKSSNLLGGFKKVLQEIFLPQGYPSSVSDDYTNYQIWDTAQAFCSTITGILATKAVMTGVGVGNVEATPLAATITWVIKDSTGHMGRILFAWWKGTSLDADSKKWRLIADFLNDAAICLELAIPLFDSYTTYILCISTAMKAIVGVAGGATRAALTQHQAIRGNLADVAAKDGSQETAVNLIASFVAVLIISLFEKNVWPLFFMFTVLHLISNYFAVSSVCLLTFNSNRFLTAILGFLQHESFLSPRVVNSKEPVVFWKNSRRRTEMDMCGFEINVGYSLQKLVAANKVTLEDLQNAIKVFKDSKYLILANLNEKKMYIVLENTSKPEDILFSYFHAITFGNILSFLNKDTLHILKNKKHHHKGAFSNICHFLREAHGRDEGGCRPSIELCRDVNCIITKEWQIFQNGLRNVGWNLESNLIISQEWRASWTVEKDSTKNNNILNSTLHFNKSTPITGGPDHITPKKLQTKKY